MTIIVIDLTKNVPQIHEIEEHGKTVLNKQLKRELNAEDEVSALNVPTEYELSYQLKFSVTSQGRELIPPETHTLVRDYNFSESELLAKERETRILSEALAHDLVSVVMRRLSSL